jgi:hypothetical protein
VLVNAQIKVLTTENMLIEHLVSIFKWLVATKVKIALFVMLMLMRMHTAIMLTIGSRKNLTFTLEH